MNRGVQPVVDAIIANRSRFESFCLSLSDEEQLRPIPGSTWVVKDFAAHLGTLDVLFTGYMESMTSGGRIDMRRDATGTAFSLDAWNDANVAERRDWPMQRVLDEARANRAALIDVLGRLDDAELDQTMHFSDPKRGEADFPLKLFLIGWAQHDPIHVADMVKALPERAADPELKAWLDNGFVSSYQAAMSV